MQKRFFLGIPRPLRNSLTRTIGEHMASIILNEATVRNFKPSDKQVTYWDSNLAGFGVMVSPGGTKTFTMQIGKARKRTSLGRYPIITLAEARAEAKKYMAQVTLGKHMAPNWPLSSLIGRFEDDLVSKAPRTQESYRWLLGRLPKHFTVKRIGDITPEDIKDATKKLSPSVESHTLAVLKILFRYAIRHNYIDKNPAQAFSVKPSQSRRRILTDAELAKVWRALGDDTYSQIVKIIILCGCRKNEVANLSVHEDMATLAAEHSKNKKQHTFPLPQAAIELLKTDLTFSGWSRAKKRLDRLSGVTDYCIHDLRRTFISTHARIGTPLHVAELLVGHISGSFGGVVGTYNLHKYENEMRLATDAYTKHLATIL